MSNRLQRTGLGTPGLPGCAIPVEDALAPIGFMSDPNRGAEATIDPPDDDRHPRRISVCDGRTWAGCVVGYPIVVSLGRSRARLDDGRPPPSPLDDQLVMPRLRALLTWGLGGGCKQFAKVDWLHGTQLSISAEYVAVEAEYAIVRPPWLDTPDSPIDPLDFPSFDVRAGFGYGVIPGTSNPARLTEVVAVQHPSDPAVRIPIPPFAIAFTVLLVENQTAARVDQVAFGTAFRTEHDFVAPTTTAGFFPENAIPIWNGAEFLDVSNVSLTDVPLFALVIFDLAL